MSQRSFSTSGVAEYGDGDVKGGDVIARDDGRSGRVRSVGGFKLEIGT